MNDIVVRLEELYALSTNGLIRPRTSALLKLKLRKLLTEIERIAADAKWKGNARCAALGKPRWFGRNGGELEIKSML